MLENDDVKKLIVQCTLPVNHSLLVFIDGQFFYNLSHLDDQLDHIINLESCNKQSDTFTLQIPANTIVVNPIHLLFIADKSYKNTINNTIGVGAASKITLIKEFAGCNNALYSNHIYTSMNLEQYANVEFYKLQQENNFGSHFSDFHLYQSKFSKINAVYLGVGGAKSYENINVFLEGNNSDCILNGLYLPCGKQKMEYRLLVEHKAANCSSKEFFKSAVDDFAHAAFDGKVIMYKGATKNSAQLKNKNLLLSNSTQIITKPNLEIYVDDVQCTHGATIGQLDQASLCYLRSRGILKSEARQMLIHGFVQEMINLLPDFLQGKTKDI